MIGGTGFLLLLDSAPIALETEDIELLELRGSLKKALSALPRRSEISASAPQPDPLTEKGNDASFQAALREGCARPERRGTLALLVFDLDGFKRVNDTLGAGDHMLR